MPVAPDRRSEIAREQESAALRRFLRIVGGTRCPAKKMWVKISGAREGYSVSQFLASAAGEKLAVVLTMDYLRREAAAGRREDFEKYLVAVLPGPPQAGDEL